jgi:hypothetical protein
MKHVVKETWIDDDGMPFRFEPLEDTLTVTKTETGFEARYLIQDEIRDADDLLGDDSEVFLVHYHRDFQRENKPVIVEDDLRSWYQGEKIAQEKDWFIFPVTALIHSGVWLKLGTGRFEMDAQGWDTSRVGAVLASKKSYKTKAKAEAAAETLIQAWNEILSGQVYCIVKETYTKSKKPLDYDLIGGYVGHKFALEELKNL